MGILGWIVFGLIVGAIAGWVAGKLVPGDEGYGVLGTIIAGSIGALVGGWLFGALGINIGAGFVENALESLLGTAGGPLPSLVRSGIAQAVVVGERVYLVDCGEGVAQQYRRANFAPFEGRRTLRGRCWLHPEARGASARRSQRRPPRRAAAP